MGGLKGDFERKTGLFPTGPSGCASPIGKSGCEFWRNYSGNKRFAYTDPTGHSWKSFWKKAAGILITVAVGALTFGLGAPLALAIGIGAFVGTTSGAIINGVPVGKAFALGAVAGLAGGLGANFAIGAGFWGGMGIGAAFGAAGGAASAAILGGNPLRGALAGGIGGGIMGAAGGALGKSGMTAGYKFGLGTAAASGAGASSSAIAGGNVGQGALLGAMGAITSAVAYSIASSNLQQAIDAGRAGGRSEADGVVAVNIYNRKFDGGLPGELLGRVHTIGEIAGEGMFFEMSNIGNKIHVYEGPLSAMTVATQKYIATGPSPDVTFTAYRSQVTAAIGSYKAVQGNGSTDYNLGTENSLMFMNHVRRSSEVE